jgi:hypothetical protein
MRLKYGKALFGGPSSPQDKLKPNSPELVTWGLKSLCENSEATPSAAKALLILRQLRHG